MQVFSMLGLFNNISCFKLNLMIAGHQVQSAATSSGTKTILRRKISAAGTEVILLVDLNFHFYLHEWFPRTSTYLRCVGSKLK